MRWNDLQPPGRGLRSLLPQPNDRLTIGERLSVSPICIGAVPDPRIIEAAFARGINFFLVSLDLHWPLYEHTRQGIARLLRTGVRRDAFVVALVSYLDEPLFRHFQSREFVDAVPGVECPDIALAGAVATDHGFLPRMAALKALRDQGRSGGVRAIGGSFHRRRYMKEAVQNRLVDVAYIRYNAFRAAHVAETLGQMVQYERPPAFGFKSTLSWVDETVARRAGYRDTWLPSRSDGYRFALSREGIDGILCSPGSIEQLEALLAALLRGPLLPDEEELMVRLAEAVATGMNFDRVVLGAMPASTDLEVVEGGSG